MSEREWDGSVDPNDEKYKNTGGGPRECKPGQKVLVPLGFERWKSSKGNPMLSLMFGCVVDLEKGGNDVGAVTWRHFALTPNAIRFFANFAKAMGHTSPFNVFKDEDVEAIMAKGAFVGVVKNETYEKSRGGTGIKSEVEFFNDYEGDWDPGFDELVASMEELWDKYLSWREKNPRGQPSRSSSGGGGQRQRQQSTPQDEETPGYYSAGDDDIPF